MTITAEAATAATAGRPDASRSRPAAAGDRPEAVRRHITALDGMRGIAVLLVMFFHFKLGPFRGGFVGVTVFFTLSGFLICSRTLSEVGRSGRFAVADFFERRVRRLAPAAIACIVGVVIATSIFGTHEQHASVAGDALGGPRERGQLAFPGPRHQLRRPVRRPVAAEPLLVAGHRGAVLPGVSGGRLARAEAAEAGPRARPWR